MEPTGFSEQRLGRIGRVMVRSMAAATDAAALSQVATSLDLGAVMADRAGHDSPRSVTAYLLHAVAVTLPAHPMVTARLAEGGKSVLMADRVNLGVAVDTPDGLIVPVIHGADRLTLDALANEVDRLAAAARSGSLTVDDISEGTFTVSNLGMYGVEGGFAIPAPPQGAILLVGRGARRFEPDDDGQPVVRVKAWCGITYDHRFIDGATAARFLQDLERHVALAGSWESPVIEGGAD